jgi:hypothetical protein
MISLLLLPLACNGPHASDSGASDTGRTAFEDVTAVLVTSDYASGTVNLVRASGAVDTDRMAVGGDTLAVSLGTSVALLNRGGENTIQVFPDLSFARPSLEFSTGDGSNPQDVALCGARLFVSLLDAGSIGAWDASTGLPVGSVDLSPYTDADGSSEPTSLAVGANGRLYAALSRLEDYRAVRGGSLLEIDCDTLEVLGAWDTVPNAAFRQRPGTELLDVWGGDYYVPDGGIQTFDMASGTLGALMLTDQDVSGNIGNVAIAASGKGVLTVDDATVWSLWCVDTVDWSLRLASEPRAFVSEAKADAQGAVWVLQRQNYAGEPSAVGTVRIDPETCTVAEPLVTALEPYSIAFAETGLR